jgi:hypothetical protein
MAFAPSHIKDTQLELVDTSFEKYFFEAGNGVFSPEFN